MFCDAGLADGTNGFALGLKLNSFALGFKVDFLTISDGSFDSEDDEVFSEAGEDFSFSSAEA